MKDEEDVEEEDFLGQESPLKLCFTCCMTTCICIVRELERKIEMLKIKKEVEDLEAEIRASSRTEQGRGRKKRRLDENEETEAIGTPNKKKKPEDESKEKTKIPPPSLRLVFNCPVTSRGKEAVQQYGLCRALTFTLVVKMRILHMGAQNKY